MAYDANPNTGFAVYDSIPDEGYVGWEEVGGTSAGAPQWSALVAIADQGRVAAKENTLTSAAAAVYALPSSDFHDITSGSNGQYSATKGYDEVTGLGSPAANLVAQGLVGVTTAEQTFTTATLTTTSHRGGFFGSGGGRSREVDTADGSDSTAELMTGVTFNSAAGPSAAGSAVGASSLANVGNPSATTPTAGASELAANWPLSGMANQQSGAISISPLSTADSETTSVDAASAENSAAVGSASDSRGDLVGRSAGDTDEAAISATDLASRRTLDATTRSLVECLDSLFGSGTDWTAGHALLAGDLELPAGGGYAHQVADDRPDGPSAAMLAVGLALTALWPEIEQSDEAPRLPRSLAERRHAVRR